MPEPNVENLEEVFETNVQDITNKEALAFIEQGRDEGGPIQRAVSGAKAVGADIVGGAIESPRAVLKGARNAVQETIDLLGTATDLIKTNVPIDIPNPLREPLKAAASALPPPLNVPAVAAQLAGAPELPDPPEPTTVTGNLIKNVSQFLVGFAAAGKIPGVKALQSSLPLTGAAVRGAIADFAVFDGHEARLSDLIQSVPALQNPVTEFLATDPNDSEAEGRLKNAVEGLGLGAVTDTFITTMRSMRSARKARSVLAGSSERVDETFRPVSPDNTEAFSKSIGDPDAKGGVVSRFKKKLDASGEAIETGVPDDIAAKGLTKTADIGGEEFFVNFSKIDTPDDVKKTIGLMADAFKEDLELARRGVRKQSQTIADAESVDAFKTLTERPEFSGLNAEQTLAVRELWHSAGTKLRDAAQLASENPSKENLFAFRKMMNVFHTIQGEVVSVRTETARALNAWKIPVGSGAERFAQMDDVLERFGGEGVTQDLADKVFRASQETGVRGMSDAIEKGVGARTQSAVQEYWINALLSGPKTHMVNTISNSMVIGQILLEKAVGARIGRLLGEEGIEVGEAMAAMHGIKAAYRDAFAAAGRAFRDETSTFGPGKVEFVREPSIAPTSFGLRNDSLTGRTVDSIGNVVRVPGRALLAEDEFFKTIGYRMELHSLSFRQATREAAEGKIPTSEIKSRMADIIKNPPDNIKLAAIDQARYQTFTSKSSNLAQGITKQLTKTPALRYLIPFVNTPDNILRFAFERTPLAPTMKGFRESVRAGGARKQTALAKLSVGSAAALTFLDMAFNGQLTGSGPVDPRERETLQRAGWQRYSIKVDDRFVAYNRLDPAGFTLGVAADLAEALENMDVDADAGAQVSEMFAALVAGIAGNITNKTYFTGLTDSVEALNDPKRHAERFVSRFAASFVPVAVKEVERLIDPQLRASSDFIQAIRSNIPILSSGLPAVRDRWGREKSFRSGIKPDVLGTLFDAISPIYSRKFDPEPIDEEMINQGFNLTTPGRTLNIAGTSINLKNRLDVYNRFLQLFGNELKIPGAGNLGQKDLFNKIVTGQHAMSEAYLALPDPTTKQQFLQRLTEPYFKAAKQKILEEFPEVREEVLISRGQRRKVTLR